MFSDQIERVKREYTDKYVLVDGSRPELARFRDVVGRVKTVNMNGQALVEFDDYHLNIGWYDIAPEFLKVVDKPPPKPAKAEAKKAPAKAEAKPAAAKAPAAKAPAAKAGKGSVADILAAARAGKTGGGAPAAKAPAPEKKAAPAAAPARVDRSKMSVADMLAAARAGGSGGSAPAKAEPAAAPAEEAPVAEAPAAEETKAAPAGEIQRVDKSGMSIDDMVAYCREHDAK